MGKWVVRKAGWVVRDGKKFFVVKRNIRNQYTDISLPKWHIEEWETVEMAALREVLEETGMACDIVGDLWSVSYWNPEWLIEARYFAMYVKEKKTDKLFSDVNEVITWNYEEISQLLTYGTDKIILERWEKFFRWK